MGACTSRHEVLKNAGEAPFPAPEDKEVEVLGQDQLICQNHEQAVAVAPPEDVAEPTETAPVDADEDKHQSLDNLANEKVSSEVREEDVKGQEGSDVVAEVEEKKGEVMDENKVVEEKVPSEEATESSSQEVEEEGKTEENKVDDQKLEEPKVDDQKLEEPKVDDQKLEETDQKSETKTTDEEQRTPVSEEKKSMFKLWF